MQREELQPKIQDQTKLTIKHQGAVSRGIT